MTTAITTTTDPQGYVSRAVQTFEGINQLAKLMSEMGTMPKHLAGKPADCFRVVVQAAKWGMDPFAVAECTSLVHGKMCYEGKLVAAALSAMNAIEGRLTYEISGSGQNASITITGTPKGGTKPCVLKGTVQEWRTTGDGSPWSKQPESMLVYRGTRQWARLYAPEALLGVYTPDEMEEPREVEGTVIPEPKQAAARELPPGAASDAIGDVSKGLSDHIRSEIEKREQQAPKDITVADLVEQAKRIYKQEPLRQVLKDHLKKWNVAQVQDMGGADAQARREFHDELEAAVKAAGGAK